MRQIRDCSQFSGLHEHSSALVRRTKLMQHLSLLKILQRFYLISICRAFVIWSVSVVGNLSKNLCPGVGHLSILLEEVKIVHFSIICSLKDMPILIAIDICTTNIFNTCALKGYVWFSLHHHPSEKLLPAILFSSHIEEEQELFKECKGKDTFFLSEWLRKKGQEELYDIFES